LIPQIKKILGDTIQVIDSGLAVAKQTKNVLENLNLLQLTENIKTKHQFYSNKNAEVLSNLLNDKELKITERDF
jgi:glutamate racemase